MTVDIHALLEKNPITKKMLQPKFGYKYLQSCLIFMRTIARKRLVLFY